jgi:hypothetical protein
MVGRFGRSENVERSTVFVATDATPPGLIDYQVPGVLWLARPNQKQRALVEYLRDAGAGDQLTAREAADAVECSKEHARQVFKALVDQGKATVTEGKGDHGADVYRWLAGASAAATPFAMVDLAPDDFDAETTNSHVWESYTWVLAVRPDVSATTATILPRSPEQPSASDAQTSIEVFNGVDPPSTGSE